MLHLPKKCNDNRISEENAPDPLEMPDFDAGIPSPGHKARKLCLSTM
jgi:hypothetical protein